MKKILAFILLGVMILSLTACTKESSDNTENSPSSSETATAEAEDLNAKLDGVIESTKFRGILSISKNGEVIYQSATGTDEGNADLTIDSPMYIGSVSKQFCAAAVMLLSQEGKLSVDDTLDKYYPEYSSGKDITIKNLLSMRSGIPEMFDAKCFSADMTEEENHIIIKNWLFSQPLLFAPDSTAVYTNANYFLLGDIVEQVSGEKYEDFIRKNFFEPLGMTNTCFVKEVKDSPELSEKLTYDSFTFGEVEGVIARGAGDIVTTAGDMHKWMSGLSSGKVISEESFKAMSADYSPEDNMYYGFGLTELYAGGIGHNGSIGSYTALNYMNTEEDCNLFIVTNKKSVDINMLPRMLLENIFESAE